MRSISNCVNNLTLYTADLARHLNSRSRKISYFCFVIIISQENRTHSQWLKRRYKLWQLAVFMIKSASALPVILQTGSGLSRTLKKCFMRSEERRVGKE